MIHHWRSIILLGLPGSGKSTFARALAELPEFVHIEAGQILRSIPPDSDSGRFVHPLLEQGSLVPDELMVRIWQDDVQSKIDRGHYDPDRQVLLLDGIPRSVTQLELMAGASDVIRIIHLACDDESVLVDRLLKRGEKHGRPDDADATRIRRRLNLHRQALRPLLDANSTAIARVDACRGALDVLVNVATIARAALTNGPRKSSEA